MLRLEEEANLERTDDDYCPAHRERLTHYCYEDHRPLCIVCARYEDHNKHKVKKLEFILKEQAKVLEDMR